MTETSVSFANALALDGSAGLYRGTLSPDWAQGRAAFGGLVGALLLRAMQRDLALPGARRVRSCLVDFIGPVAPGDFEIQTRTLRAGRALTHADARLVQGGQVCTTMAGVFGAVSTSSLVFAGPRAPSLPPADDLPRLPSIAGVTPRFAEHFDFRYASGVPFAGEREGTVSGYVRHDEAVPLDEASLLALIDAWPPTVLAMLQHPAPSSSVTWMVDVLAELPRASTPFVQYEARTIHAHGGYASIESRTWSPSGELLAASRQLTLEFS